MLCKVRLYEARGFDGGSDGFDGSDGDAGRNTEAPQRHNVETLPIAQGSLVTADGGGCARIFCAHP